MTGYPPRLMLSASLPEIACGGTRSRCASVRVGCRSVWVVFVGGHAPLRRRFRQEPPRLSPPASREAKGAEVSADESITACGCEEVDAAAPLAARDVPRLIYEGTKTLPSWHDTTSARRGTPRAPSPHPETVRIKGYPEQHSQHTQMDAERLNQLEARLENLGQRLEDLRGYL